MTKYKKGSDPTDKSLGGYLKSMAATCKRLNAATGLASIKHCKAYDDCDFYILFAEKDTDKSKVLGALAQSLYGDADE